MQQAIDKAASLVEAQGYIQRFKGRTIVVKVGGSIMDEPNRLGAVVNDICFMSAVGMKPIVVHGGGKAINEAMAEAGLEAQFVQGHRYTDDRTLAIAEHVLVGRINAEICDLIERAGHKAMGLHSLGSCAVFAKRLMLKADSSRRIDIGLVGQTDWVNADLLHALIHSSVIPVVAPIGRDHSGGKLNINADSVAGHVAAAVAADKLVLISDTHGIRTSKNVGDLASHLTRTDIERLISEGVINAGMLPKTEAGFIALEAGVAKVHVIDGRIPHALLLEIYTDQGIGTEIVP